MDPAQVYALVGPAAATGGPQWRGRVVSVGRSLVQAFVAYVLCANVLQPLGFRVMVLVDGTGASRSLALAKRLMCYGSLYAAFGVLAGILKKLGRFTKKVSHTLSPFQPNFTNVQYVQECFFPEI